jgi:hypothetical protein
MISSPARWPGYCPPGAGYQVARAVDELLIRLPLVKHLGSNLEAIARRQ